MASIKGPQLLSKAILPIDINEQKWDISLPNDKRSKQVCPKAPFLVLDFSTFPSTTPFFLLKLLHYAAMQKTILCVLRTKTLIL